MVRDGRATVNSIISRKVTITGFDLSSYRQCMTKWNHAIETMHNQCKEIGSDKCLMVSNFRFIFQMHRRIFFLKRNINLRNLTKKNSIHTGLLRTIGATSGRMDAKNSKILRYSME